VAQRTFYPKEAPEAQTSTYLNFDGTTEAAFTFCKSIFGTEFVNGIMRMSDVRPQVGQPEVSPEHQNAVVIVQLPILGGHLLMGTDAPAPVNQGINVYICLHPDSRSEADPHFASLSEGGESEMPLMNTFGGDYYGSLIDPYGVQWMIDCSSKS